jgi:riboflavin biosynthesis pyrimidine reductase
MVSTVDGFGIAPNGLTRGISSDTDRNLLGLLRALADVIIVGSSTAVKERYGPERVSTENAGFRAAAGQAPHPPIALVSNRLLDLDPTAPIFTDAPAPTLVFTAESSPAGKRAALAEVAEVIVAGDAAVEPKNVVDMLVERGMRRMLTEGGPRWLGALFAADLLDEFCVTRSARVLSGDSPFHIVRGGGVDTTLELTGLLRDGSDLYLRYRVRT